MTTQAPAGFFSGSNGLNPSSRYPWLPMNFSGRVRILACKGITKRGTSEKAFIAEFEILTSNLAHLPPDDKSYVAVGSRRSWYQGMKEPLTAYPSVISFLYACLKVMQGRDQVEIDTNIKPVQDKWLNRAVSDENPLADAEVMVQTANKQTRAGKAFTLHAWSVVPAVATAGVAA
jgi:hypothetical protein